MLDVVELVIVVVPETTLLILYEADGDNFISDLDALDAHNTDSTDAYVYINASFADHADYVADLNMRLTMLMPPMSFVPFLNNLC